VSSLPGIFICLFCCASRGWEWEAAAHSASAEGQSRKFFFLKGKNKKEMARAKIIGKIFCFVRRKADAAAGWDCRPTGGNPIRNLGRLYDFQEN